MKRLFAAALLACCSMTALAQVTFKPEQDKVDVEVNGQPFTTFHYGAQWAKPFLHPLRTATGIKVTRGFPLEEVQGESKDHFWHRGLWYTHGDINGVDFWREAGSKIPNETKLPLPVGRMVVRSGPKLKAGKDAGTLTADLDLVGPDKKTLGTLREQFTFRRAGANNVIDVQVTFLADRGAPLKLGDTEEGALGLRFADEFRQDRGAILSNSDGLVGTEKIWGKRASWVDYSTTIRAAKVGIIIFDHPRNPKHPTYWHARGYGLCAANPFGEHDFHGDKARDGSVTIPKGGSLSFRYRVVIHSGRLDADTLKRLYASFSGEQ